MNLYYYVIIVTLDGFTIIFLFFFQAKEAENLIKLLRKDSHKVIYLCYSFIFLNSECYYTFVPNDALRHHLLEVQQFEAFFFCISFKFI